jgi:hypothetical protein
MDVQSSDRKESPATPPGGAPPQVVPTPDSEEPRGIERGVADADKKARTGSPREEVRNTPPAGTWNDTSSD